MTAAPGTGRRDPPATIGAPAEGRSGPPLELHPGLPLNLPVWMAWLLGCFFVSATTIRLPVGFAFTDVCFAVAILGMLVNGSLLRTRVDPWIAGGSALAAVAIAVGGTVPGAGADHYAVGARLMFIWACLFVGAAQIARSAGMILASMISYATGCAVSGLLAVSQALTGLPRFADPDASAQSLVRNPGWTAHVNDQGGALAVALAFCTGLLFTWSGTRFSLRLFRLALAVIIGLCITGLIQCGSISGMASAIIGCLAVLSRVRLRSITLLGFGVVAVAAVALGLRSPTALRGGDPVSRYLLATGQGSAPSSLQSRLETYRFALEWIGDHPLLGRGLGDATGATYDGRTLVHNIVLLFWFQGGVLLVAALLVILARMAWAGVVLLRDRHPLAPSLFGGLTATLVYAQTAPVCFQRYFWFPGLLIIGLLAHRRTGPAAAGPARWPRQRAGSPAEAVPARPAATADGRRG